MPCNPAIGGTGKGHLVRELDALGGEMARAADKACIQYRLLNRGKGPAVHSLRAQADRRRYQEIMKHTLELQDNLSLKQAEIVEITVKDGAVESVVTETGAQYFVKAAVVCTGTYLTGRTIVGEVGTRGRAGRHVRRHAGWVTASRSWGSISSGSRPARRRASTRGASTFPKWSCSPATTTPSPSRSRRAETPVNQAVCWLTYTNEKTHGSSGKTSAAVRCFRA